MPGFKETSPRDYYKGKIKDIELGVINMDKSTGPGTHFIAYFNSPDRDKVIYYDSYAVLPPKEIQRYLHSNGKVIAYNSTQHQPIASVTCGYYCIYVLKELSNGRPYAEVLDDFSYSPEENEQMIQQYFNLK
ncbi:MAG TPA: hypothetical protein PLS50_02520 [Candidatus Dojkabacteria bacterium]|nr:hypothetical protein [Candidatus Dojkabacteria bacterium]